MKKKKAIVVKKSFSPEEVKEMLLTSTISGDLKSALKELGEDILPLYMNGDNGDQSKDIKNRFSKKSLLAMRAMETETHVALMESFDEAYQGLAKEISQMIIKDCNCITVVEKTLAEVVANAYVRIIDNSKRLNNSLNLGHTNQDIARHQEMMSRQIDKAHKQYFKALNILQKMKMPLKSHINTKNAFIAQNQQINIAEKSKKTGLI